MILDQQNARDGCAHGLVIYPRLLVDPVSTSADAIFRTNEVAPLVAAARQLGQPS
jgi:hypothetical protein